MKAGGNGSVCRLVHRAPFLISWLLRQRVTHRSTSSFQLAFILTLHLPGFPITPPRAMAKTLTKSEIASSLAESVGVTKKQAVEALEALVTLACKNAKNKFTIPGLGKLVLVNRKARMGRNPATGATIKIPAKRVVKFRIAKAAKDAILGAK
ncbi:MAG TPA: HU family DNA-binding protein [Dongiaceae bacterium]|nr:HU family DNA-binding protein [Dongiaceae bacterium]